MNFLAVLNYPDRNITNRGVPMKVVSIERFQSKGFNEQINETKIIMQNVFVQLLVQTIQGTSFIAGTWKSAFLILTLTFKTLKTLKVKTLKVSVC